MDAWLHSDLVGIPVTLAVLVIVALSVGIYLLIGNVAGLFVGKLLFILALGGLIGFIVLRSRLAPSTKRISAAPFDGPRRPLILANEALESPELCAEVSRAGAEDVREVRIVVPVVASSRLHALSDDVDDELRIAQRRLDGALATVRATGIRASGRVDVGEPMSCLLDGLREFQANEVIMLCGGERGWQDAEDMARRVHDEVGLRVTEVDTSSPAPGASERASRAAGS